MDCDAKNGLLIFLLVLSGILTAIVTGLLVIFCRKKVKVKNFISPCFLSCHLVCLGTVPSLFVLNIFTAVIVIEKFLVFDRCLVLVFQHLFNCLDQI